MLLVGSLGWWIWCLVCRVFVFAGLTNVVRRACLGWFGDRFCQFGWVLVPFELLGSCLWITLLDGLGKAVWFTG